jgi:hypothetical protein
VGGSTAGDTAALQRRLTGYGRISAERAEASEDHRAVLLSEGVIRVDDVHLYVVPVPEAFRGAGRRTITVALAYDPPVRATRLDYLASRMSVFAYHGAALGDVQRAYATPVPEPQSPQSADGDLSPGALTSQKLTMLPADTDRGRGTNQAGTFVAQRAITASWGSEIILAIRSVNRWDLADATQPYALAVAFEHDDPLKGATLYAE